MRISLEVFLQGKLSKAAAASSSNSAARLLALWPYVGDQAFWRQLAPSPVRHIKTEKKKKVKPKQQQQNHLLTLGLATLRERFILLSKLSWAYPLPFDALASLGCLLSVSRGCQMWWALSFWPLWLAWSLWDTRQAVGCSPASASLAGSAARQSHREEGQRDQRGFNIINHPSKAFQRMVSESPLRLSFPQERRREDTNHLRGMCLTDRRSPCCWQLAIALLESIQSQKFGVAWQIACEWKSPLDKLIHFQVSTGFKKKNSGEQNPPVLLW